MCSKHVPKLRAVRSAQAELYGCLPEAPAPPVSGFQLLGGFADQRAEAHEAEVHYADEVGAVSRSPARR